MHQVSPDSAAVRDFTLGVPPFTYGDLFHNDGLRALAAAFDEVLDRADPELFEAFNDYRRAPAALNEARVSDLLIRVATHLGLFVARLFKVESEWRAVIAATNTVQVLFDFKRDYIARRVRKLYGQTSAAAPDEGAYRRLEARLGRGQVDEELRAAETAMALWHVHALFERPSDGEQSDLSAAARQVAEWAEWLGWPPGEPRPQLAALLDIVDRWHAARLHHIDWLSYHAPKATDPTFQALVQIVRRPELPERFEAPVDHIRQRVGFQLTDRRMTSRQALAEVHYCIYCHERGKDSCRKGLHEKSGGPKKNPLGIKLEGCPLEERISEAHWLRKGGDTIAALAMICVDNPMTPGTGHRICNDCMKSCIYQKQEPVNIPQVETSILSDVLRLPYGFEIYSLLTRWNPLNVRRPYPRDYQGHNVLVVGLGPAGYTLSHHLVNEGFGVVGIDGLKLEPLPDDLVGADLWPPRAVRDYGEIEEELDDRVLLGFGGVAEYGITVRWDKNFLKVIYLNLLRRTQFRCYGGVRFGANGTIDLDDAWSLGFHHIALASGAGRPTIVELKNNLIRGIRKASDFLMALQLSGAYKAGSLANLQVELPALVIGGGLTGIDTATELAAYYPVQIEKLLERVEILGVDRVLSSCDTDDRAALTRMLGHARELREEREKLHPDVSGLVRKWGGVALVYRRSLNESPAYRLNHEEVEKALEEGISFIEGLAPLEAVPDAQGAVEAVRFRRADGSEVTLPARSVMVAAGTTPNTIYEREAPGTFELDQQKRFFKAHKLVLQDGQPTLAPAGRDEDGFFTSYRHQSPDGRTRFVSYYGDNHPQYAGNVVKAMASAKYGHLEVVRLFASEPPAGDERNWRTLIKKLDDGLRATVDRVTRLTPTIIEVVVKAPLQAQKFQPGQFFRFQNYEARSRQINGTRLSMEGVALTGAWVDREQGLLSLITLEVGVSSRLCAMLRPGDPVVVMGPTGTPTEIPEGENVVLCGGGLGNAVLFSVAKAMRERGNKVIYFAAYRKAEDVFKREEIESASDQVVWSVDGGPPITPQRPGDLSTSGNIVEAMNAYAGGHLGICKENLNTVDRIIAIGSDRMMAAVTKARVSTLAPHLKPGHCAIGSINSPMQCMMKEVCAQCLQRHVDPQTGAESFVFSCFNQDQPLDRMDWKNLAARLKQNSLLERVSSLWLDHLLATAPLDRLE